MPTLHIFFLQCVIDTEGSHSESCTNNEELPNMEIQNDDKTKRDTESATSKVPSTSTIAPTTNGASESDMTLTTTEGSVAVIKESSSAIMQLNDR